MAFEELKQRASVVWGAAPFERIADRIANIHDHLARELAPQPGEQWLDVGTGTGGVAVRAARAGADVTGSDLAPTLIETAKRLAAEEGLEIRYEVGDAEQLPYADGSFDVVSSSFGAIFAPDHGAVARELARVTRPGGLRRSSRRRPRAPAIRSTGAVRSTRASCSGPISTSASSMTWIRRSASRRRSCGTSSSRLSAR